MSLDPTGQGPVTAAALGYQAWLERMPTRARLMLFAPFMLILAGIGLSMTRYHGWPLGLTAVVFYGGMFGVPLWRPRATREWSTRHVAGDALLFVPTVFFAVLLVPGSSVPVAAAVAVGVGAVAAPLMIRHRRRLVARSRDADPHAGGSGALTPGGDRTDRTDGDGIGGDRTNAAGVAPAGLGCLLCRVADADAYFQRRRVWADAHWRLSVLLQGPVAGFAHLEPWRHIPYVTDLDGPEAATLGSALARATAALREATGADKVYVYVFGDRVPHLHFNLAPHHPGGPLAGGPGLLRPDAQAVAVADHESAAAAVARILSAG
ncbi:hypothetical protein [Catellatospora sp. NPDC049609]|uniref:hypothetical protein n=1 Tax=Catellatospora sp. NPDC049609 TaxID=3155505 RepID=UPI003432E005